MFNQTALLKHRIATSNSLLCQNLQVASKCVVPPFEPGVDLQRAQRSSQHEGLSTFDLPAYEGFCTHFSLCLHVDAQRRLRRRDWLDHAFERLTYRHRYQDSTYDVDGPSNMALARLMHVVPPARSFLQWADRLFVLLRRRGVAAMPAHQIVAEVAVAENPFCYELVHSTAARLAMCEIAHTVCLPLAIPPTVAPERMFDYVSTPRTVRIAITYDCSNADGVQIADVYYRLRDAQSAATHVEWICEKPRFDRSFLYMKRMAFKYNGTDRHMSFKGIYGIKAILVRMQSSRFTQAATHMELCEKRDASMDLLVSAPLQVCADEAARHGLSPSWYVLPTCDISLVQWNDYRIVADANVGEMPRPCLFNAMTSPHRPMHHLFLRFRDARGALVNQAPWIRIYVLACNILRRWDGGENLLFRF